jgi:hypothetical protein
MLTTTSFRVEPAVDEARFPLAPDRQSSRCACGGTVGRTGECTRCRTRRMMRGAADPGGDRFPTPIGLEPPWPARGAGHEFRRLDVFGPVREPEAPLTITADTRTDRPAVARAALLTDAGGPEEPGEESGPVKLAQTDAGASAAGVAGGGAASAVAGAGAAAAGAGAAAAVAAAATCSYSVSYANLRRLGCGAQCGAMIRYDITGVRATGGGCPATLTGLMLTEAVATDAGCTPGAVTTGAGCTIGAGGTLTGCRDTYGLCASPASFPAAGCTERYTQQLFVGGVLAETRTITFRITRAAGRCSGTVRRT